MDGIDIKKMAEAHKAPAWVRLILCFVREKSFDINGWGYTTRVYYKELFSRQYFVRGGVTMTPPVHFNCRCAINHR